MLIRSSPIAMTYTFQVHKKLLPMPLMYISSISQQSRVPYFRVTARS